MVFIKQGHYSITYVGEEQFYPTEEKNTRFRSSFCIHQLVAGQTSVCVRLSQCVQYTQDKSVNVSVFVCVFTPCLERLVAASPCLVHWGAAICSSSGKRGVWHRVQFMTLLILSVTTTSDPQAVHTANQRRAITLNTSWEVTLPSTITL